MPYPRKLTDEAEAEIAAIGLARHRLLSDKELSVKYGVSMIRIQQIMQAARAKLEKPIDSDANESVIG